MGKIEGPLRRTAQQKLRALIDSAAPVRPDLRAAIRAALQEVRDEGREDGRRQQREFEEIRGRQNLAALGITVSEENSPEVIAALRALVNAVKSRPEVIRIVLVDLLTWSPEGIKEILQANSKRWGGGYYASGDEQAPFASEALLYPLLGKEPARSLLARLSALCQALGYSMEELVHGE